MGFFARENVRMEASCKNRIAEREKMRKLHSQPAAGEGRQARGTKHPAASTTLLYCAGGGKKQG